MKSFNKETLIRGLGGAILVLGTIFILLSLFSCVSPTPMYRRPVVGTPSGRGYNLPSCEHEYIVIQGHRVPCQAPIVDDSDVCTRRFGEKACRGSPK